ncbi:MAG TPA: DUF4907 domain-containing protein [Puia sp.]|nr:DUF4907 domain-containing protein [Puia sp.]
MIPTINRTKRKKSLLFIVTGLVFIGITAFIVLYLYKRHSDYIYVQVRATQNASGWGYEILTDGKVYIRQDFVPAIPGRHAFPSREKALRVGKAVLDKIEHKQMPVMTLDELKKMGIITDSLTIKASGAAP